MNPFVFVLVMIPALLVLALIGIFILALFLRDIARAESDVNGDPERDAGFTDEEIKVVCGWCPDKKFIRGNPHSKNISDGMCPDCAEHFEKEAGVQS